MKRIKDNVVLAFNEDLIKRRGTEFVEIPKSVADYHLGIGPKPAGIGSLNAVPIEIVEALTALGTEKMGLVQDFLDSLDQSKKLQAMAVEKPESEIETEEPFIPLKEDPDNMVEDLDKPLNKMNKGELNMHAQLFCEPGGFSFSAEGLTNAVMREEIEAWEAKQKK